VSCNNEGNKDNNKKDVASGVKSPLNDELVSYEQIFDNLVVATNLTFNVAERTIDQVCERIFSISNKAHSLRLYNLFLEKALSQNVITDNNELRRKWFLLLGHITMESFSSAQKKNGGDFSYWNKMINFYSRYTDEIERVEKEMMSYVKEENIPINKRSQLYLHYLRSDLDNLLFTIFKLEFNNLTRNCTNQQKLFLNRKFEELKKYTAPKPLPIMNEILNLGNKGALSYEEMLSKVVAATNISLFEASKTIDMLCRKILDLSDVNKALGLLDHFIKLTIAQEINLLEANRRQNCYAKQWDDIMTAFLCAQSRQNNDFKYWDNIFAFWDKCTREIVVLEQLILNNDSEEEEKYKIVKEIKNKRRYLKSFKGELKTWVRVMRDFYFPNMSKNYTTEQKDNILRRFKEVEKHTITPPHYPGGRTKGVY
jgi:hypothetical protein